MFHPPVKTRGLPHSRRSLGELLPRIKWFLPFVVGGACGLAIYTGYAKASHTSTHVCNGNNSNYHTGAFKYLSNIKGIKATIEVNNPANCDENATNSNAWSVGAVWAMVNEGGRYIQAGWVEKEGEEPRHFAEYNWTGKPYEYARVTYGPASPGYIYTYSVNYQSSCINSKGINVGDCWVWTNATPDQYVLASNFPSTFPNNVQYSGETWDSADQMPGGNNNPTGFTSMQYRNGSTWQSPGMSSSDAFGTHPQGKITIPYSNEMYIWDNHY